MNLLVRNPGRSGFSLTYQDVQRLPISIADKMLEQIEQWRAKEGK